MNQKKFVNIKKLHDKLLIPENFGEINTLQLRWEILCYNSKPERVKKADKRSHNWQPLVVKIKAGMIKLCNNLLKTEKENYVVKTKDIQSSAVVSTMLLGHVNFSMNNMRRD